MWQLIPANGGYLLLFCNYINTSVNQNIRMTWDSDWNIIVNVTNYVFVIGQFANTISSPPSSTEGVTSVLLK